MSTVLDFATASRPKRRLRREQGDRFETGEIVLFPGIRIERNRVDLSYRIKDGIGTRRGPNGHPPRRPA